MLLGNPAEAHHSIRLLARHLPHTRLVPGHLRLQPRLPSGNAPVESAAHPAAATLSRAYSFLAVTWVNVLRSVEQ